MWIQSAPGSASGQDKGRWEQPASPTARPEALRLDPWEPRPELRNYPTASRKQAAPRRQAVQQCNRWQYTLALVAIDHMPKSLVTSYDLTLHPDLDPEVYGGTLHSSSTTLATAEQLGKSLVKASGSGHKNGAL